MRKAILLAMAALFVALTLTGCFESDADVAAKNLSKAAEQFEIDRRIVLFNGITDKYVAVIEGKCSVESSDSGLSGSLQITCKLDDGTFKKSYFGLSDNVSYFVEQTDGTAVSTSRYRVIFKPETVIPNFDRP